MNNHNDDAVSERAKRAAMALTLDGFEHDVFTVSGHTIPTSRITTHHDEYDYTEFDYYYYHHHHHDSRAATPPSKHHALALRTTANYGNTVGVALFAVVVGWMYTRWYHHCSRRRQQQQHLFVGETPNRGDDASPTSDVIVVNHNDDDDVPPVLCDEESSKKPTLGSITTTNRTNTNTTSTCVTVAQHATSPPLSPLLVAKAVETNRATDSQDSNDSVPLRVANHHNHPAVDIPRGGDGAATAAAVIRQENTRPRQIATLPQCQSTEDAALALLESAAIFTMTAKAKGLNTDDPHFQKAALDFGCQRQNIVEMRDMALAQEMRGYHFSEHQRCETEAHSERQHRESMAAKDKDKEWLTKLRCARKETYESISVAAFRCFLVGIVGSVYGSVYHSLWIWTTVSFTEWLCYGIPADKPSASFLSPTAANFIGACPLHIGERACMVGAAVGYMIGIVLFLNSIGVAPSLRMYVSSMNLAGLVWTFDWLPALHLYPLCLGIAIMSSAIYLCVHYKFKQFYKYLDGGGTGTPAGSDVTARLAWFDDAANAIQLSPIVLLFFVVVHVWTHGL